ncbi:MAG: molybdenum cofactor biosynthesis protein MoaE [Acidiferrobacterales bacterium]|nr:molybdenum cofactor biosynthesis protein MoaE [Acidiferrobacterales bacterium]
MKVEIRPEAYDPWVEIGAYQAALPAGSYGASAVFVGTMRDFNEGDDVESMLLEHYPGMTEQQLEELAQNSLKYHGLIDVMVLHRVGEVRPNDPIVVVAAWSAHRKAAFDACREMMENLKSVATFWKKEQLKEGVRWVEKNTAG